VWMAMPMLVAPGAGALGDRIGNGPLMFGGLLLQGVGLGWVGLVAEPGVGFGTLVAPLAVAGVGVAMCFPTVAAAVVSSVPAEGAAVAAGTSSALRELGGVFGIAVLAAVFAAHGGYAGPEEFIAGFRPAMAVAAAVPVLGLVAAGIAWGAEARARSLGPAVPAAVAA